MGADYDLVIFDCDGVLIDSELIACAADAEAFSSLGMAFTTAEIAARFTGMPDEAVDEIIAHELGHPLPAGFRAGVKRAVMQKFRTELQAIPGVQDLLHNLKTRKCVASSSSPAKLALGLVETDLYESFYPNIFSTSLVTRGKPHPDIFLYAAEQMKTPPTRALVIEDSPAGVTAAVAAGMACVGFTGGSHCGADHSDNLKRAGAFHVIDRLDQILKLVN